MTSTSSFNKLCLDTEVLMLSLIPACAVIPIRKQFPEDDEGTKVFMKPICRWHLDKSK